jgi:hypothetical protein
VSPVSESAGCTKSRSVDKRQPKRAIPPTRARFSAPVHATWCPPVKELNREKCRTRSYRGRLSKGNVRSDGKQWSIAARTNNYLQLRVLGFRFLQDGDVEVSVFPEGEEILVGGKCPDAGGIGRLVSVVPVAVCARFPPKSTRRNPSVPRSLPSHAVSKQ